MSRARYKIAVLCAVAFAALVIAAPATARPNALPFGDPTPIANPSMQYQGWAYFIPANLTGLSVFGAGVTVQPYPYRQTMTSTPIRLAEGSLVYIDGAASMTQMYGRPLGTGRQYALPSASLWLANPASSATGIDAVATPSLSGTRANVWLPGVLLSPLTYQYSGYSGLHPRQGDILTKVGGSVIDGTLLYVYRGAGASAGVYGLGTQPQQWLDSTPSTNDPGRRLCC